MIFNFFRSKFSNPTNNQITAQASDFSTSDFIITKPTLHTNLKQLEFISCLEMYLDKSNSHLYSLKFLQELKSIKAQAQNNTLHSLRYYNS